MPFFEALVDRFYAGVAADPDLLAVYPEPDDLSGARHRLTLFLAQYWGGPTTYDAGARPSAAPDAPRAVRDRAGGARRMARATCARRSPATDPPPDVAARLHTYFDMAAEAMRNRD